MLHVNLKVCCLSHICETNDTHNIICNTFSFFLSFSVWQEKLISVEDVQGGSSVSAKVHIQNHYDELFLLMENTPLLRNIILSKCILIKKLATV